MQRFGQFGQTNPPATQPPGTAAAVEAPALPQMPDFSFFDPEIDGSDYIFYQTLVQGLNGSTNLNGQSQIQIDAGIDFYWIATTYQADLAGAVQTTGTRVVPLVTVIINDTGSRKNLMNNPVPISSLAGPGGDEPYRLLRPRLFKANSTINFTYVSYVVGGTTYSNLYLILHGYYRPASQ